jgi:hypothetical protein
MLIWTFVGSLTNSAFSLIVVGFCLLSLMARFGLIRTDDAAGSLLNAIALGFCWHAIIFAIYYFLKLPFAHAGLVKFGWDVAIILIAALMARSVVKELGVLIIRSRAFSLLALGMMIGTLAFFAFPHSLDSGQLMEVQSLLLDGGMNGISMFGYAGLAAFSGQIFSSIPVVVVAAAFKPILVGVLACTADYATSSFDMRYKFISGIALLGLILGSHFGGYGVLELGKDSIFGVLFSLAFLITLCRADAVERGSELGLYFAAAAATGIIAVPFMLVAYVLWLLPTRHNVGALKTLRPLYLFNFPILPLAITGFLSLNVVFAVGIYLLVGIFGYVFESLRAKSKVRLQLEHIRLERFYSVGLLGLVAMCVLLMPVEMEVSVWRQADGGHSPEVHAPLDGRTGFWSYLFVYKSQVPTILFGLSAGVALLISGEGVKRPGLFALVSMPFAALACLLIRIHLKIPLLSGFHVLDLVKDIPQWYAGPVFGVLSVLGANRLSERLTFQQARMTAVIALAIITSFVPLVLFVPRLRTSFDRYTQAATFTGVGGFKNPDMALLTQALWLNFAGTAFYVDRKSEVGTRHFYDLQMFGPRELWWYDPSLQREWTNGHRPFGVLISKDKIPEFEREAAVRGRTIKSLGDIEGGSVRILAVSKP